MGFEEEVAEHLAASRSAEAQADAASRKTLEVSLAALDRLEQKVEEAAEFLAHWGIPTEPIIEEQHRQSFWSGTKKVAVPIGQGWALRLGLIVGDNGLLWQEIRKKSTPAGETLRQSHVYDFDEMRETLRSGNRLQSPGNLYTLTVPSDSERFFISSNVVDPSSNDLEGLIVAGVADLVRKHSRQG